MWTSIGAGLLAVGGVVFAYFRRGGKPKHGKGVQVNRSRANAASAVAKIKGATHPNYRDDDGRSYHLVGADRRAGGMWVIASPWHNGQWIGGYYISNRRACYTCCNKDDYKDYDNRVEEHEVAHDLESRLKLVPPWHYAKWRHLFLHWRGLDARHSVRTLPRRPPGLPGVRPGDEVEVDYADGSDYTYVAGDDNDA